MTTYEKDRITDGLDIFFWIFNSTHGFVATHWHRALEINYVLEGEVDIMVNGKKNVLLPGDLFLIDSFLPHSVSSQKGNRAILIQLPYTLLKRYIPDIENLIFKIDNTTCDPKERTKIDQFIEIITKMQILFEFKPKGSKLRFNSLVFEMMYQLYHNFSEPLSENDLSKRQKNFELITRIMDYTNEHYMEGVSLSDIAGVVCFQKEYFCHFFKKNMGMTYLEYLCELRLSHICSDLLETELSLKSILEKNGFTNYKLFRKLFFEKFGMTPTRYRRRDRSQADH